MTTRTTAAVSVYLVLRRGEEVLLLLRQNTGFMDNQYGLVSGHVEADEPATEGMIREAYEEAGIRLKPENLRVAHIMHRQSGRLNVDIFFECTNWDGEIQNREPHKCAELKFFSLRSPPKNLIGYVHDALRAIEKKSFYSESGWNL
ncbi:NUDIX hydrolase [Simkania negevensis]|uniref:NUDIX hydrolase n=1 Tax=Simkania negevensis (strain ATCC VR-1471 / DSM 27360 / Z) TaxID=331113 RepID=F8L9C0_SIMNZ|nr:NUDIX domain-containing protein [Simkania negevensis]MCB1076046.1 NUDIX domain-containing protein [Simkania sp.]CCB89442.1 NUDIX hydrolase [Simkania negevensis Z]